MVDVGRVLERRARFGAERKPHPVLKTERVRDGADKNTARL